MKVLCVGVHPNVQSVLAHHIKDATFDACATAEAFANLAMVDKGDADLVVCGGEIAGVSPSELAQVLRNGHASQPILYTVQKREGFDKKTLIKNGFNDAFLLPMDRDVLVKKLEELQTGEKTKTFRPVRVVDLEAGAALDFSLRVYLPQNKKHVVFATAGSELGKDRAEKLKAHNLGSVYVTLDEMPKFYDYTAKKLASLGSNSKLSETERREKLQGGVRDLFSSIANTSTDAATIDQGKALVDDLKAIVDQYITQAGPSDWYQKLVTNMGGSKDAYSHSSAVSAFASLFAIGLGGEIKPEDMAVAGMFHDLGMMDVSPEIVEKQEADRTPDEQKLYQQHPEYSINLIKARKLIVPTQVVTAILQHHERWDGSGYPKGLQAARISKEAQILALADQFDYLTRVEAGKKQMTPAQAIAHIKTTGWFDPELLKKVAALIPTDAAPERAVA